jgi:hypothetical protein
MPFTPFHFGAHLCVAMPFRRKLDIPAFLLANIIVDIEPLIVMIFNLKYPLHGYAHTFAAGIILSPTLGMVVYLLRKPLNNMMGILRMSYIPSVRGSIISAFLGHCLHILFDAPIYHDIRPCYPLNSNPLYGVISTMNMYLICSVLFIPAIFLYLVIIKKWK